MKKQILSVLLSLALILSLSAGLIPPARAATSIEIGQYVQMGTYYGEPILWRCVDIDENGPLMLSDKIICLKPFDAETSANSATGSHSRASIRASYGSNYWADSNLRSWLNSSASAGNVAWLCGNPPDNDHVWNGYNDYADEAGFLTNFSQSELNAVKTVTQKSFLSTYDKELATSGAEEHDYYTSISSVVANYDDAYAEQVTDRMFLLDVKQINAVYNNGNVLGADYYIGEPTAACVANSEYTNSSLSAGNKWRSWLHSPYAGDRDYVRNVDSGGDVYGTNAYYGGHGVRPAFYFNLESASFQSGSGTASDPYTVEGSGSGGTQSGLDLSTIPDSDQTTLKVDGSTHLYVVLDQTMSWSEAKTWCESLGGHLATITSEEEQQAVLSILDEKQEIEGYWLGGYKDTEWKWVTGEPFSYANWDYNQPDGGNNMVMQMFSPGCEDGNAYRWDDTYNTGDKGGGIKKQGVLCEWDDAVTTFSFTTNVEYIEGFPNIVDKNTSSWATEEASAAQASGIAVFSTEKSLTVETGSSMWLGFGKFSNGQLVGDWTKMAIVVSDPTVISLSDYEETEYGYSIEVTGKKQGATNVTITDTESGLSTNIIITVRDSYVKTYSYAIDNMETFYPNNEWEKGIQTNIYDLNGLYANNYQCDKTGNTYKISFDVYNSRYHTGAVDIYDKDGTWIDCEEIKKFSMISSLWDTGEQAYYLISDAITGKLLTYEQASFAEHTSIAIEVPDGGYFSISNNFAESPGTFLFNSCDIIFDGTCTLIDAALDVKNDKVAVSAFSDLVKEEITKDKAIREQFIDIFKKTAKKEVQKCLKNFATNEIDERYADISGVFENLLNSLDINWKHLFKSATGVAESAFTKFAGPAGIALKGCFAFAKGGNQMVQAVHLAASIDAPYAMVFSSIDEGEINPHGVIVNTNGNMDAEAVLQVFRVSNNNTIEVVLDGSGDDHLKKYELYNICFVKNDQLVQPNGKVTVQIPIPDGMTSETCNVYRQESDGSWTILAAHIEGNYLVFETDHFSLYGVVGNVGSLSISSLPYKTQYNEGDVLDPEGLVLSLDGELITDGFICSPTVFSQVGEQNITVQYGFASTEFTVNVQASTETEGSTSSGSFVDTHADNCPSLAYTDVDTGAWYHESVDYVLDNGLMSGYGNGSFGPTDELSRAMLCQVLYNSVYTTVFGYDAGFTDVTAGTWYEDAVNWAAYEGIVTGYGDGRFGPDDPITREQLAVILWRYDGEPAASGALDSFTDAADVSDWASDALAWAVERGIVTGKGNGVLDPQGRATRAETATMLMRYLTNTAN